MILLLNGAFGIGKTTVARLLVARLGRAVLFDPELIGMGMQRTARVFGRSVGDFQDLKAWRRLTIAGLRITRVFRKNIVVPMAISNAAYLDEIREGIEVMHFCLVAPVEVVHERLRQRGDATEWEYHRASECCIAHQSETFATHIAAANRDPRDIAEEILRIATGPARPPGRWPASGPAAPSASSDSHRSPPRARGRDPRA